MSFKEKILEKSSNSYTYYKDKAESLQKEVDLLKQDLENGEGNRKPSLRDTYFKTYGPSGAFCNKDYVDFYLSDEFEDTFKEITSHLDSESRKLYKWIFMRILFNNLVTKNTIYLDEELEKQKAFSDFKIKNSTDDSIAGFKFSGDYNLHGFIDLGYSKEDLEFLKDKDIIDAGAFTGDTALPLSQITNKNVYAFEPFEESFELLEKNISDNEIANIVPVAKSLGDINGERTLFLSGQNIQGITSDPDIRPYDTELKVEETTIDSFVEENNLNIGLISVDVEGAEMNLLKGAVNTIKTQRPILEISIYHKTSDFFEIIPWIIHLDADYEFKIAKENPWPFLSDTVVQCRPK